MTIKDELLALKRKDGLIVAEEAERWAKTHKGSALHKSLEWDDKKAGHNYRVWQVRQLIALHVVTETGQRTLVSLSIDRKAGGYRSMEDILPQNNLRDVLIEDALTELDRIQRKYDQLKELSQVWEAKDNVRVQRKKAA